MSSQTVCASDSSGYILPGAHGPDTTEVVTDEFTAKQNKELSSFEVCASIWSITLLLKMRLFLSVSKLF